MISNMTGFQNIFRISQYWYCRVFQSARKFKFGTGGREPPAKSYKNIFQFMVDPRTPREIFLTLHFEKLMCHRPAKPPRNVFLKEMIVSQTRETTAKCFFEKIIASQTREPPTKVFCFAL